MKFIKRIIVVLCFAILLTVVEAGAFSLMYQPPLPRMLTGYRTHAAFQARLVVQLRRSIDDKIMANVSMKANGAEEYMLSHFPNFLGAKWKPFVDTVKWSLPNDEVVTLYAIFKKKDFQTGLHVVSPVAHYTFDKRDTARVLERVESGVIDWSGSSMIVEKEIALPVNYATLTRNALHTQISKAQLDVQQNLYHNALEMLLNLRLSPTITLREKMLLEAKVTPNSISAYANEVRMVETGTSSPQKNKKRSHSVLSESLVSEVNATMKVHATGYLSLINDEARKVHNFKRINNFVSSSYPEEKKYGFNQALNSGTGAKFLTFYRYAKMDYETVKAVPYYSDDFTTLVLDLRGYSYPPSMFPVIENERGEEVLNAARYQQEDAPFVRYVRNFDAVPLPNKTLFVKAYDMRAKNFHVVISERYWQSLVSNEETLNSVANGNFWILLD